MHDLGVTIKLDQLDDIRLNQKFRDLIGLFVCGTRYETTYEEDSGVGEDLME